MDLELAAARGQVSTAVFLHSIRRNHWKDAPPPESWGEEETQNESEMDAVAFCK